MLSISNTIANLLTDIFTQGVYNMTLRDTVSSSIKLLVDDGYNATANTIRANFFESPEAQKEQRKLRSIVEIAIGFAKSFHSLVLRNQFLPELQEAIILICYEFAQLKMMMHPIRPDQLPENVIEYFQASLNPGLFEITPEKFCGNILSLLQ